MELDGLKANGKAALLTLNVWVIITVYTVVPKENACLLNLMQWLVDLCIDDLCGTAHISGKV